MASLSSFPSLSTFWGKSFGNIEIWGGVAGNDFFDLLHSQSPESKITLC